MRKRYLIIAALIMGMMASVSSCKKKTVDTEPTTPTAQGVEKTEPAEDQLAEKIENEVVVYGEASANDNYSQSVKNRIINRVGAYNHETTDAVVIFSGANNTYTEQDYYDIYDCYKKGGDVIVINPSIENFINNFRNAIREKGFSRDVERYNTQGITREQWMKYAGKKLMKISGSDSLLLVGNAIRCLGLHVGNNYIIQKMMVNGEMIDDSKYQAGIQADGLAEWVSSSINMDNERTRMEFGKDGDLSEISSPEIQVRDFDAIVFESYNNNTYGGVVRNVISAYAAHSLDDNIDWYQVDQNITLRNNRINPVPDVFNSELWFDGSYHGHTRYITPLDEFSSKMYLSIPSGTAEVIDSHPQSENGSQTEYAFSSSGTVHTESTTGSLGFSSGYTNRVKGSLSHTETTTSFFCTTTGSSKSISDLSVMKNTILEDGVEKVKWNYTFKKPTCDGHTGEWWAGSLSISDCGQQNSMYCRVLNPSGVATIHCENNWKYSFFYKSSTAGLSYGNFAGEAVTNVGTIDFALCEPVRYVEEWVLSCTDYGDIAGNIMMISAFENRINQDIFEGSESRIRKIGGSDSNDITHANSFLDLFVDRFSMFAESYAASGFTGTFTFKFKSVNTDKVITKDYTISVPSK